ncbi:MAG: hypothetical protein KJO81_08800 [Gammaproteobacteria bacterium]|nr:hypothetical protein [Gammaproteobacteria bacterium]
MTMIEITPADEKKTSVSCKPGEGHSFQFLISNVSENKIDVGLDLLDSSDWMTIAAEPNEKQFERTLQAKEDSAKRDKKKITVNISPPEDLLEDGVNSQEFQFRLRVYDRDDYNNVFESEYVSVSVERPISEKGFLKKIFGKKDKS